MPASFRDQTLHFDFNGLWSKSPGVHSLLEQAHMMLHSLLEQACNISPLSHRYLVIISPLSHLKGVYQALSHHCLTIISQVYHRYLCNISPLSHQGPTSI